MNKAVSIIGWNKIIYIYGQNNRWVHLYEAHFFPAFLFQGVLYCHFPAQRGLFFSFLQK